MIIRAYNDSDEPHVASLWRKVFGYAEPHNDPALTIKRKLAAQPELFFVATVDENLVGTVMGGYDGHRGWVYLLAVDPRTKNQGIGTALMRHLEQAFAERGCLKINLQVHTHNAEVVRFYERLGYQVEQRVSLGKVLY